MPDKTLQIAIFFIVTAIIALLTYLKCRGQKRDASSEHKEYFLAGGGLSWIFVAGSITLTNLSTDQLVGMNGNQMALLAWWELSAVVGLLILAKIFIPIYYRYSCTTTTELLEKRYQDKHIRAIIGALFFFGNMFIFCPIVIYTGSLFMKTMFNVEIPLMIIAASFAIVGALYAIFGGLRAVAVSDTYSGVLLLAMAILVVVLALQAINYDFSGIPSERLTLIGDNASPLPWHVLLTGMIFQQTFYWSTNQTITQRAMAAPNVNEAQKGIYAAAVIRLVIVPAIIVVPGIISFKLYGDIGDAAYGRVVGDLMPHWLSGIFAAAMAAGVLTSYNSQLNSAVALYVCDIHEAYIQKQSSILGISRITTLILVAVSLAMVPVYAQAESIINLVQQLWGLLSMPILSVFIVGLLFKNVEAKAAIFTVIFGVSLYAFFTFIWTPLHYLHLMFITVSCCVAFAVIVNKLIFGRVATWGIDSLRASENSGNS